MNLHRMSHAARKPKTFGASHRWKVLAAGVVANAAFSAAAAGIPTTGVWMRTDYRLDNAGLGLVLGSIGLGLAVSELPWGVATDRFGDRPVLLIGLAGFALALFMLLLAGVPSGTSVPPLALMCAMAAVLTWRWLHRPPMDDAGSSSAPAPTSTLGPLADWQIWRVALAIGILCAPQFAVITFGSVFLHDFGRLGTAGISVTMAAVQLGAMVMRVWSGRHTDRHGNRRAYLRGSTLVAAASFAILAAATGAGHDFPVGMLVMLLVAAGICVSAWHGVAYTELATLAGATRAGTALGMANTVVYAGLFVTPLVIAHLLSGTSWTIVWLVAGIVALSVYTLFPRPATGLRAAIKASTGT